MIDKFIIRNKQAMTFLKIKLQSYNTLNPSRASGVKASVTDFCLCLLFGLFSMFIVTVVVNPSVLIHIVS